MKLYLALTILAAAVGAGLSCTGCTGDANTDAATMYFTSDCTAALTKGNTCIITPTSALYEGGSVTCKEAGGAPNPSAACVYNSYAATLKPGNLCEEYHITDDGKIVPDKYSLGQPLQGTLAECVARCCHDDVCQAFSRRNGSAEDSMSDCWFKTLCRPRWTDS